MKAKKAATLMVESINDLTYSKFADKHFAKKAVLKDIATGREVTGPDGMVAYVESWLHAIPNARVEILDQWVEEERAETRFMLRGTFSGALPGPGGEEIVGGGETVEIEIIQRVTVEKDKVRSAVNEYDLEDLIDQLDLDIDEMDDETEPAKIAREDTEMAEKIEVTEGETIDAAEVKAEETAAPEMAEAKTETAAPEREETADEDMDGEAEDEVEVAAVEIEAVDASDQAEDEATDDETEDTEEIEAGVADDEAEDEEAEDVEAGVDEDDEAEDEVEVEVEIIKIEAEVEEEDAKAETEASDEAEAHEGKDDEAKAEPAETEAADEVKAETEPATD